MEKTRNVANVTLYKSHKPKCAEWTCRPISWYVMICNRFMLIVKYFFCNSNCYSVIYLGEHYLATAHKSC